MNVREIMSPSVACAMPNASLREIAALMVEHDCGEIPVCNPGRKPIGVITDRDIVCRIIAKGENPLEWRAEDCMSKPVVTATPDMAVEDCGRLMEQYQVRRLPVVDESGACCGMVAQADLAVKAPRAMTAEVVEKVSEPTGMPSGVLAS